MPRSLGHAPASPPEPLASSPTEGLLGGFASLGLDSDRDIASLEPDLLAETLRCVTEEGPRTFRSVCASMPCAKVDEYGSGGVTLVPHTLGNASEVRATLDEYHDVLAALLPIPGLWGVRSALSCTENILILAMVMHDSGAQAVVPLWAVEKSMVLISSPSDSQNTKFTRAPASYQLTWISKTERLTIPLSNSYSDLSQSTSSSSSPSNGFTTTSSPTSSRTGPSMALPLHSPLPSMSSLNKTRLKLFPGAKAPSTPPTDQPRGRTLLPPLSSASLLKRSNEPATTSMVPPQVNRSTPASRSTSPLMPFQSAQPSQPAQQSSRTTTKPTSRPSLKTGFLYPPLKEERDVPATAPALPDRSTWLSDRVVDSPALDPSASSPNVARMVTEEAKSPSASPRWDRALISRLTLKRPSSLSPLVTLPSVPQTPPLRAGRQGTSFLSSLLLLSFLSSRLLKIWHADFLCVQTHFHKA